MLVGSITPRLSSHFTDLLLLSADSNLSRSSCWPLHFFCVFVVEQVSRASLVDNGGTHTQILGDAVKLFISLTHTSVQENPLLTSPMFAFDCSSQEIFILASCLCKVLNF